MSRFHPDVCPRCGRLHPGARAEDCLCWRSSSRLLGEGDYEVLLARFRALK